MFKTIMAVIMSAAFFVGANAYAVTDDFAHGGVSDDVGFDDGPNTNDDVGFDDGPNANDDVAEAAENEAKEAAEAAENEAENAENETEGAEDEHAPEPPHFEND